MTPIIDSHHHIWPQADLPWLNGPMQPRIFGPYESIMRDYPLSEFAADAIPYGVVKSVYVQANWAPERFAEEARWVQSEADAHGLIGGIVAYADFTVDDVRPQLDRLQLYPLVRGVRQQLHWHEIPLYRFAAHAELARDPVVQRNVARLADYDWVFDLQVFDSQMPGAGELADAAADTVFVLQHAGMLEDTSASGREHWQRRLSELALHSNVNTKLSAFGTFLHRNDPAHIARMIADVVGIFGVDRCLFGSNFPIEKIWTDYGALVDAFVAGSASLGADAQRRIFHDNAFRIYGL